MNMSSKPSFLRCVFIDSFMAKRAISVQTTMASNIQETMFMTVPRFAMGTVCRLNRACVTLSNMVIVEFDSEETASKEGLQAE
jgi:hypothetical protein